MRYKLHIGAEVRAGREFARAKRYKLVRRMYIEFEVPHPENQRRHRTWKKYRRTQYKAVPASL